MFKPFFEILTEIVHLGQGQNLNTVHHSSYLFFYHPRFKPLPSVVVKLQPCQNLDEE